MTDCEWEKYSTYRKDNPEKYIQVKETAKINIPSRSPTSTVGFKPRVHTYA